MATETDIVIIKLEIQDAAGVSGKNVDKATKEVDALATSMLGLQQANKKLREERNRVDTSTDVGIAKIKQLNDAINKNNDLIKANSSNLEKQRLNVGNYQRGITEALKNIQVGGVNVGDVLDKVSKANEDIFQGLITGYKEAGLGAKLFGNAARTALTLTGIGILIAGLATIIAYWDDIAKAIGLADDNQKSYFKTQQEGIDASREKLEQYNKELEAQNELLKIQGNKEKEIADNRKASALSNIDSLKEEQKSLGNTIGLLLKAVEIEKGRKDLSSLTAEEFTELSRIIKENGGTAESNVVKLKKAFDDTSKAIVNAQNQFTVLSENEDKEAQERAEKAAEERSKQLDKDINERAKQLHEQHEAQLEEERILQERIAELRELDGEDSDEAIKKKQDAIFDSHRAQFQAEQDKKAKLDVLYNKDIDDQVNRFKKLEAAKIKNRQDDLSGQKASIDASLELARTAFGRTRAIAVAETIVNTVRGMVRAIAEYPFPYSAIVAALVGATGSIQTQRILGINFKQGGQAWGPKMAKGGYFNLGGNSHAQGGTKFIGSDGTRFEAEKDEGIFVMKREANKEYLSSLNQKHGGNPWTSGAYPSMQKFAQGGQIVADGVNTDTGTDLRQIVGAIQDLNVFVAVEDINTGQGKFAQVVSTATVF